MEQNKVKVLYNEDGKAVRVQLDFDLYKWLMDHVPQDAERAFAVAH